MRNIIARFSSLKINKFVAGALVVGGILAMSLSHAAPAAACHCQDLNEVQVNRNTFSFSSDTSSLNGGHVDKVIYNFGDGTTAESAQPQTSVTHTYATSGSFTVTTRIFATIDGQHVELDGSQCTKKVEVKPQAPVFACTALTAQQIDRTKFHFTATASVANGAVFKALAVDFGDGQSAANIAATGTTAAVDRQYDKEGTYKVTAKLTFATGTSDQVATCATSVTVSPDVCAFNATLPKNSPDCVQPKTPQTPQPQLPAALPSTGPTEILGGAVGLGSITAAGAHYIRSRRNLRNVK